MKIEVNIEKRYFFILLGAILIIGSGIFVYAYKDFKTGNPPVFGHSSDEVNIKLPNSDSPNQPITLQEAIDLGKIGGSNIDFSEAGKEITGKPTIDDDPRNDFIVTTDSTVKGAILGFNKVKGKCKDVMIDLYTFEDKQLGSVWSWIKEGASYDEGDYAIVPLTNGKFKITKILGQQGNGATCPSNDYIVRIVAYIS